MNISDQKLQNLTYMLRNIHKEEFNEAGKDYLLNCYKDFSDSAKEN